MPISINPLSRPFARLPFAAAVVALFASVLGVAQAAEFDEKVQAPAVRSADQLRAHMRVYSAREAQARLGGLGALLADRSLARERFEMSWDLQRALDAK
ncbi:MAG TPA: hypothetical protein VMF52_08735, partial [Steroidobacteraceae bacterium]|nr:hypothetical protein [Steroidobacteraceae bacterium]